MKKLRVCFCVTSSNQWLGGVNYFDNLLSAIHSHELKRIVPVVLLPHDAPYSIQLLFNKHEVLYSPFLSSKPFFKFIHKLLIILFGKNVFLQNFLYLHRIDILSHFNPVGNKLSLPFLPWIPDFQHLYLPHLFTDRNRKARDKNMSYLLNKYPFILLSSNSASNDMCSWSPDNCKKARVLKFVSAKMLKSLDNSSSDVLSQYNISKPFFLVPNQYWRHKNHSVLFKALAFLRRYAEDILIVSTGSTDDLHDSSYYLWLCELLQKYNISDSYLILGEIQYEHLSCLMRESLAVINPSLFEGWSTTVEEAKSLGKQVILSDISVHREQSPTRGFYFPPHDHRLLGQHMLYVMNNFSRDEELCAANRAAYLSVGAHKNFASRYAEIVTECYNLSIDL